MALQDRSEKGTHSTAQLLGHFPHPSYYRWAISLLGLSTVSFSLFLLFLTIEKDSSPSDAEQKQIL